VNEETNEIAKLSHPTSMNEAPPYNKVMPTGVRAMGSFDLAIDPHKPIYEDLSLLRDYRPLKRGQRYGHRGTTTYNPKPEDPEQEALFGKKVYKEKISQEDPRAVIEKMKSQEDKIATLQTQVETLVKILSQNQPVPEEVAPSVKEEPSKEEILLKEIFGQNYEDMKYQELVKLAKSRGIENLKAISKDDVIAKLKEFDANSEA